MHSHKQYERGSRGCKKSLGQLVQHNDIAQWSGHIDSKQLAEFRESSSGPLEFSSDQTWRLQLKERRKSPS